MVVSIRILQYYIIRNIEGVQKPYFLDVQFLSSNSKFVNRIQICINYVERLNDMWFFDSCWIKIV